MFGFFKSASFVDPQLGELRRSSGMWRGMLLLEEARVPLILSGSRAAPDPEALNVARCCHFFFGLGPGYFFKILHGCELFGFALFYDKPFVERAGNIKKRAPIMLGSRRKNAFSGVHRKTSPGGCSYAWIAGIYPAG
jgi:hypothetical protein